MLFTLVKMSPKKLKNTLAKQDSLLKMLESVAELGKKCVNNPKDTHSRSQFRYKVCNVDNLYKEINDLVDLVNDMKSEDDSEYEPDFSDLEKSSDLLAKVRDYQCQLMQTSSDQSSSSKAPPSEDSHERKARVRLPPLELPPLMEM
uniref:Uncharacterized protein n=2 Tax=Cacopsylla melanoneura TaxID=428564 RepID=A0A8D9BFD5_9HEMI